MTITRIRTMLESIGYWIFLLFSDPGWLRLRMGIKLFLATILSAAVIVGLALLFKVSLLVALVSMAVAPPVITVSHNKQKPFENWLSVELIILAAMFGGVLALLIDPYHPFNIIISVIIMAFAVYLRGLGPRGIAVGMAIFQSLFFFVVFGILQPTALPPQSQIPWVIPSVVVAGLVSFMVKVMLPDQSERGLRHLLSVLNKSVGDIVDELMAAIQNQTSDDRMVRTLRRRYYRLFELTSLIQNQLQQVNSKVLPDRINPDQFAYYVFDISLAANECVSAGVTTPFHRLDPMHRMALLGNLRTLRLALSHRSPTASLQSVIDVIARLASSEPAASSDSYQLLMAVDQMARALLKVRALADATVRSPRKIDAHHAALPPIQTKGNHAGMRMRPTTRQAIQVLVSASIALGIGQFVSQERWYWAVLAAYVAISGTNSRLETVNKGWQRLIGTLIGIVVGSLIAFALHGHLLAAIVLILFSFFMVFYWASANYAISVIFVTIMLSSLYVINGEFSISLLLLRLGETGIGAVIGIFTALFVFPIYTGKLVRTTLLSFLTNLGQAVDQVRDSLTATHVPSRVLLAHIQGLQSQVVLLRNYAKPLTDGLLAGGSRQVQMNMLTCMSCAHDMRDFTRLINHVDISTYHPSIRSMLVFLMQQVNRNIEALKSVLNNDHSSQVSSISVSLEILKDRIRQSSNENNPRLLRALDALHRIDRAIVLITYDNQGQPHALLDPANRLLSA